MALTEAQLSTKLDQITKENKDLSKVVDDLNKLLSSLETRVRVLEQSKPAGGSAPAAAKPAAAKAAEDDDDFDMFASDDEEDDAAAEELKQKRVDEYNARKAKKTAVIAKSSVLLDVKPWDDETDMAALEKSVRSIEMPGLLWGASKLMPVAYNVKKLQIVCVVEDELVSVEELSEKIEAFEDYVQSVDVAAFSKI